jgi:transcription initiation factor IIE alpha subunit
LKEPIERLKEKGIVKIMARGKHQVQAELQNYAATVLELHKQIKKLTEENEYLKNEVNKNLQHHAFQIAQMHEHLTQGTAPELEALKEENIILKRALRGELPDS